MKKVNPFEYYGIPASFKIKRLIDFKFIPPSRIAFALRKLQGLVYYPFSFIFALLVAIYCRLHRFDIIYSRAQSPLVFLPWHNAYFEAHEYPKTTIGQKFNRWLLKRIKGIVFINHLLAGQYNVDGIVARNAADIQPIIPKEKARRMLGMPKDGDIVCYTGHLYKRKGADIIAEASKLVPKATFYLVGGLDKEIRQYRQWYGDYRNLEVIGHVIPSRVRLYQMAADVLVLPNISENGSMSPLKLFEYMASGNPIVASNLPSITEILSRRNALLVEAGDVDELAEGIKSLLGNKALSSKLASQALQDASDYTWEKRAEKIVRFIGI